MDMFLKLHDYGSGPVAIFLSGSPLESLDETFVLNKKNLLIRIENMKKCGADTSEEEKALRIIKKAKGGDTHVEPDASPEDTPA